MVEDQNTIKRQERKVYRICIIILIVLIILLQTCRGKRPAPKPLIETFVTTEYIEGKSDTIYIPIETPYRVEVPVIVYVDKPDPIDTAKVFRYYDLPFKDSLIDGLIHTKVDIDSATIAEQSFTYTPKFPKYITRVDTFKIDSTTIITQRENPKTKLFVGIGVGGNATTFQLGPKISLLSKKELLYSYQYDLLDKTHNIGFSMKLRNPFKKQP